MLCIQTSPAVTRPRAWCGSDPELCSSFDILLPFFPTAARPCWWGGAAEVGPTSSSADGERAAAPRGGGPGLGGWTGDSTARGGCCSRVHGREKVAAACRAAACGLCLICIDTEETVDENRHREKELKLRLLNWDSTIDLPHQPFEASPGCAVISNSGYEIFAFSYEMEMVEAALGSIQHHAQNLDYFNWNQPCCVNLWCQGNIHLFHVYGLSVKGRTRDSIATNNDEVLIAESKSFMFNLYMTLRQIVGSAIYSIEQDLTSKFSCTRLCWYDDMHGVDTVPVVRVDPPVVDDNATVEVPQIQQQGPLSSSSVMDIQYLQLSTPLPQMQTPDRLSGEPPAGHQLVWSIEAIEDCSCGTFGSGLSTDGRSPYGSFCSLRCRNHVLSSSFSGLCHFSHLYLALFYGATMYFVR